MTSQAANDLKRAEWLARVLDSAVEIPGLRIRVGIDPLLGLWPGAGDAMSALLALYPLYLGFKWQLSPVVLFRMALNVAIDVLAGWIPVLGDVVDVGFKANMRNVALLKEALHRESPPKEVVIDVTPEVYPSNPA